MFSQPEPGGPQIRWSLLGPLQGRAGERVVDIGPPRRRSILALLLAHAGQPVAAEGLVAAVWGERPPDRAGNVIHKHIGALRRLAEPGLPRRAQGSWLLSRAGVYRLTVGWDSLDLLRFRGLLSQAEETSDETAAFDLQCAALALWRGRAAGDVRAALACDSVLAALDRELATAAAQAGQRGRRLGRPEAALPALTLAARVNDSDEQLHEQLVLCLAAAGRREEALACFRATRLRLIDRLGIEPGPALRAANQAVLEDRVRTASTRLPVPAQLPADLRHFVGRGPELQALGRLVSRSQKLSAIAVITGTAGVGKTSLAVHVASRVARFYPGGQLHVDLRGFDPSGRPRDPDEVLAGFLSALDLPSEKLPPDVAGRAALWRSAVAARRLLVVLDNARDTAQVAPLLVGGSGSLLIVTSRLQLRGLADRADLIVPLGLLTEEESSELLDKQLEGRTALEPAAARAVHEVSSGLPLSLALLSARARHTPEPDLRELAEAVRDAGRSLAPFVDRTAGRTDARAVLSWSYEAVSPAAAQMFRVLAIYPGAAVPTSTAAALAGVKRPDAEAALDELVEANLLTQTADGRHLCHDLLRRLATERLAETDERDLAETRMYEERAGQAVLASRALWPSGTLADDVDASTRRAEDVDADNAARWFKRESPALIALVLSARVPDRDEQVVRLARALELPLDRHGQWVDAGAVHQAAVQAARRERRPLEEAQATRALARIEAHLGHLEEATRLVRQALELIASVAEQPPALLAETHRYLSWVLEQRGELAEAVLHARTALRVLDDDGPIGYRGAALNQLGRLLLLAGDDDAALVHCSTSIELLEHTDHRFQLANALGNLGTVLCRKGRLEAALASHERSVTTFRSLGAVLGEARALALLGDTLQQAGREAEAGPVRRASEEIFAQLDDRTGQMPTSR